MEITVLDKDLKLVDIIDNFDSLQWIRRYYKEGKFELHCPVNFKNINALAKDNYIWKDNSNEIGIIEQRNLFIDTDGTEKIKINGRFFTSILDRRSMIGTGRYINKEFETIMRNLVYKNCINVSANRKLPILLGDINNFSIRGNYEKSYGEVLEELSKLSEVSNIGFYIRTDLANKKHYFETYKGLDRSVNQQENSPVVFSRDEDNLYEQEYEDSNKELKTTAIVAGEGEGTARTVITVNNDFKGLERRELFVDARDLQKESQEEGSIPLTDAEYKEILIQRGLEKLSEHKEIQAFEGKINSDNYIYKKDYDLGDIVTVMDKAWNIVVNTRITEINEVYEGKDVEIVPVLGDTNPSILDKLKRK